MNLPHKAKAHHELAICKMRERLLIVSGCSFDALWAEVSPMLTEIYWLRNAAKRAQNSRLRQRRVNKS